MKPEIVYVNILGRTMRCEVVPARHPFEKLNVAQLRQVLDKLGRNHAGMPKREMIRLCCAMTGQAE